MCIPTSFYPITISGFLWALGTPNSGYRVKVRIGGSNEALQNRSEPSIHREAGVRGWGPLPAPPPRFPLRAPGVAPPRAAYSGSRSAAAHTAGTAALGARRGRLGTQRGSELPERHAGPGLQQGLGPRVGQKGGSVLAESQSANLRGGRVQWVPRSAQSPGRPERGQ